MDQKARAKTRERKLSNTLESKERRAWPKPQCPCMMPRRHSSFQTVDATDFSEQVPRGSSSTKVTLVIMRNLWAQVLEFRGIYLCLGAGWSTTQVWALRRDWGAERRGTTYKFWNLEPPWSRSGALVSVWYTGARPSPCIRTFYGAGSLCSLPILTPQPRQAKGLDIHWPKVELLLQQRERAREAAGSRVKAKKSGTTVWASPQSRDVRYPQPSVQPCAPP
ncbi:hypothetical protein CABS03_11149 [Colletotrichum abscissum]|uniref:Uncharacterized protein n=4 Tax=Colletotrichum acutatum species complex TaxID=2707335 RepID=A0A9P9XG67_9PEZI|nr:hypothetical protein CABS02_06626 [Colletotrichum abscissum]